MAEYDLKSKISVVNAITPAVRTTDNTPAAIDMLGYNSAVIVTNVGAGGVTFTSTDKIEFKLTHSDDDSTYAAVESTDVIMPYGETLASGGIFRSFTAAKAAADTVCHTVGYVGKKRYLKILADFSGTHGTGTAMSCTVIQGNQLHSPYSQSSYES